MEYVVRLGKTGTAVPAKNTIGLGFGPAFFLEKKMIQTSLIILYFLVPVTITGIFRVSTSLDTNERHKSGLG